MIKQLMINPTRTDPTSALRRAAWGNAGAYIVGSVLYLLVAFNAVGTVPKYADGSSDAIAAANFHLYFSFVHDTYGINFASSLEFVFGAMMLVPLGVGLRHLYGSNGYWQTLMAFVFAAGAVLFTTELLMSIGRIHFIASTDWSKASPASIIGAGMTSNLLAQVEGWIGVGFYIAVGFAMLHAAGLVMAGDKLPHRLGQLGMVVAVLYLALAVVSIVDPLSFLFQYIVLVGGAILAPAWAIWLGYAAGRLAPDAGPGGVVRPAPVA